MNKRLLAVLCLLLLSSPILINAQGYWKKLDGVKVKGAGSFGYFSMFKYAKLESTYFGCGSRVFNGGVPGLYDSVTHCIGYSRDSGRVWELSKITPTPPLSGIFRLFDLKFFTSKLGVACGENFIYLTSDGGQNWNSIRDNFDSTFLIFHNVSIVNERTAVVSDITKLFVYLTRDAGQTWTNISPSLNPVLSYSENISRFISDSIIYLTQSKIFTSKRASLFYRTSNIGASWDNLGCVVDDFKKDTCNSIRVKDLGFANHQIGFCVGSGFNGLHDEAKIFATSNAGDSWYQADISEGVYTSYTRLHIFGDTILASTDDGRVRQSNDLGRNWFWKVLNPVLITSQDTVLVNFNTVCFFSPKEGIASNAGYVQNNQPLVYQYHDDLSSEVENDGESNRTETIDLATIWIKSAFPNPASSWCRLRIFIADESKNLKLQLYDCFGSIHGDFSSQLSISQSGWSDIQLNLPKISSGLYYIIFRNGSESRSHPLMVIE